MTPFIPGLVHTPVTPFARDLKIDYTTFKKVIAFHLKHGAQALAVQMHAGESVSLSDADQRRVLDFVIKQVKGKVPVIAHVSDSGTAIAADRARYAEQAGAAAIVATSTYYWTPPANMVLEHFASIGGAVKIPFYVLFAPDEMGGTHHINADMMMKLIDRLPNFAGVADASLDWQFMINVISNAWRKRPDFQLVSGTEYMVSAGAVGATSMFTSLAAVAPRRLQQLFEICRTEKYFDARALQEDLVVLRQTLKPFGRAALKGAMRYMGRSCGQPRPPLDALTPAEYKKLAAALKKIKWLSSEPKGW
jgi:dihydrodipicolinate synthase/N-acetylneuraminate lyase